MRYLNRPDVDDAAILTQICGSGKLMGVSGLATAKSNIESAYRDYLSKRGCPNSVSHLALTGRQKKRLLSLYENEVNGLQFFQAIRNIMSAGACAMCGKLGTHSIDHFVEKGYRPQFAFYSPNLVPACSCNSRRTVCLVNGVPVSPLHPYFDKLGRRSLMRASFSGLFYKPTIDVVPCRNLGKYRPRVEAHIEAVVKRNMVDGFLIKRWEALISNPRAALLLKSTPLAEITFSFLQSRLRDFESQEAGLSGSPNNWISIFYSGVASNQNAIRGIIRILAGQEISTLRSL